jgi:hypothetical protein
MAHYRVSRTSGSEVTFEDETGQRHVARTLSGTPPMGAIFHGVMPARGFATLLDATSRSIFRVIVG